MNSVVLCSISCLTFGCANRSYLCRCSLVKEYSFGVSGLLLNLLSDFSTKHGVVDIVCFFRNLLGVVLCGEGVACFFQNAVH